MKKFLSALLCVLLLCGPLSACESKNADEEGVTLYTVSQDALQDKDAAAKKYTGKTYHFSAAVMRVRKGEYVQLVCDGASSYTSKVTAALYLPEDKMTELQIGDLITFRGKIEGIEEFPFDRTKPMILIRADDLEFMGPVQVSGKIEVMCKYKENGEYYNAPVIIQDVIGPMLSNVVIVLPEELWDVYQVGDVITAEGKLSLSPPPKVNAAFPPSNMDSDFLYMESPTIIKSEGE